MNAPAAKRYRPETRLVHAGILRSEFGETSEALFLTQGYVYETAASAGRRFKGEEAGYQYSRFSNPTVTMFEQRMCALEGAQAARATATGMAAVTAVTQCFLKQGDHLICGHNVYGGVPRLFNQVLANLGSSSVEAKVRGEVQELTNRFPLYSERTR